MDSCGYVTATELAYALAVSSETIRRWCKLGLIREARKMGNQWRIPMEEAKRVMEEGITLKEDDNDPECNNGGEPVAAAHP